MEFWEEKWTTSTTFWDKGESTPGLKYAVDNGYFKGHALVPGCGSGYDVEYLANHGYQATGLDISPTCIKKCKDIYNGLENANFICADFFNHVEQYDSAFDYTFFCAIDPAMRKAWGQAYSKLIKSGGAIIILMFPLAEMAAVGPPHTATFDAYKESLPDFELIKLFDMESIGSFPKRKGFEQLSIWKRK